MIEEGVYGPKRHPADLRAMRTKAGKTGKLAGALTLTAVGAGAGAKHIKRKRGEDWVSYSKSDTSSAFGVVHD